MVLQTVLTTTVPVQSKQPTCREAISKYSTTQANPENKMKQLTKEFNQNMSSLEIAQSKQPHSNSFKSQQTNIRRTFEMGGRALDPQRNISRKEYDEMLRKMLLTAKKLKLASSSNVSGKNGATSSKAEIPVNKQKSCSDSASLRVKSSRKLGNLNQNLRRAQLAQQHSKLRASSAQSTSRISGTSVKNLDLLKVNFSQKISKTTAKRQLSSSSNLSSKMEVPSKKQKLDSGSPSSKLESPTKNRNGRNQIKTKKIFSEEHPMILRLPKFALEEGFLKFPSSSTKTSSSKPASSSLLKAPSSENFLPELPPSISLTPVKRELTTASEGIVLDISKKQHIDHALSKNESTVEESKKRVSSPSSGLSQHLRPQVSKRSKEPSSMPKDNRGLSKSSQNIIKTASSTPKTSASDLNKDPVQSKQPRSREAIPKSSTTRAHPENKMEELTKEFNQNMSRLEIAQSKQLHSNSFKSQQTNIQHTFEMKGRSLDPLQNISQKQNDEMLRNMSFSDPLQVNFSQKKSKTTAKSQLPSCSNLSSKMEVPSKKQKLYSGSPSSRLESPTEKQNGRNQVKTKKIPSEELPNFALEEGFLKIPSSSTTTSSSKPASASLLKLPSSENFLPELPPGISLTPVKRELTTASEGIVLDISKKQHIDHALSKNESTVEESKKRVSSPSSSKTSFSSNNIPTFTTRRDLQATKSDCSKSEGGFSQHLKPQVSKCSKEPSSMPKDNRGLSKSSQRNPKTASSTPKTSASDLNKVDHQKPDDILLNSMYSAAKQDESFSNPTSVNKSSAAAASPPRQGGFYFPFL